MTNKTIKKNQQNGKQREACTLRTYIPAKKLITIGTVRFGRRTKEVKMWLIALDENYFDSFDDCSTLFSLSEKNIE